MSAIERVKLRPAARDDLVALRDPAVQKAVIEALLLIEKDVEFGAPLDNNDRVGDLRG